MTARAAVPATTAAIDERETPPPRGLRWWKEILYVLAFYVVYSFVRNNFGSAAISDDVALHNARRVISIERAVGLFHEETLQDWFLDGRWFIKFWNIFYGTAHFVVTIGVLVWLFRRVPHRYPRFRNALGWTTGLALIGFATFPLMPPRLLPASYGFLDTLEQYGGLWSFSSGAMAKVSNQFAAMPSLHFGWATWCALAVVPATRSRRARMLVLLYPTATLFAIMVTANHYWIDALGGALVLSLGYLLGSAQWEWREDRLAKRAAAATAPATRR